MNVEFVWRECIQARARAELSMVHIMAGVGGGGDLTAI